MRRAPSGCGRCVLFRPLAVRGWSHSSGVYGGYTYAIIVDEYISEDDAFDLFSCQLVRRDPVDLFFLQCRKKALHPRVIKQCPVPLKL